MADWAIYWPRYPKESGTDGAPVTGWLTDREWLVDRLRRGDRLWLFIAGDACGDEKTGQRAYLAQLLVVEGWGNYAEHEPGIRGSPRFHIHGIEGRCILLKPPSMIDSVFRQPDVRADMHIGIARQTPFELDDGQVTELLAVIRISHSEVYKAAIETLRAPPNEAMQRTRLRRAADLGR